MSRRVVGQKEMVSAAKTRGKDELRRRVISFEWILSTRYGRMISMSISNWMRWGKCDTLNRLASSKAHARWVTVLPKNDLLMESSSRLNSISMLSRCSIGSLTWKRWKRIDEVKSFDSSKGCPSRERREYLKTLRLWTDPKLKASGGLTTSPATRKLGFSH